jgi:hypothetical protein
LLARCSLGYRDARLGRAEAAGNSCRISAVGFASCYAVSCHRTKQLRECGWKAKASWFSVTSWGAKDSGRLCWLRIGLFRIDTLSASVRRGSAKGTFVIRNRIGRGARASWDPPRQGALIELLTEQQISQSIDLIDALLSHYLHPETAKLEAEIEKHCSGLSSEELRMLPDGFAQSGSGNPRVVRSWPHSGKY